MNMERCTKKRCLNPFCDGHLDANLEDVRHWPALLAFGAILVVPGAIIFLVIVLINLGLSLA